MAKRCRDCHSVAPDDIGFCGACGGRLGEVPPNAMLWQYMAVVAATGGFVGAILFLFHR